MGSSSTPRRRTRRADPPPRPREPTYHAHAPERNVTDWLQDHSGACEACGQTGPRGPGDLFQLARAGSRAYAERHPYERLCAADVRSRETLSRWERGELLQG